MDLAYSLLVDWRYGDLFEIQTISLKGVHGVRDMYQVFAGKRVETNLAGFLVNENDWNLGIGEGIAGLLRIEMSADHWYFMNLVREEYAKKRSVPFWEDVLARSGWSESEVHQCFLENAPENIARIAGFPNALPVRKSEQEH